MKPIALPLALAAVAASATGCGPVTTFTRRGPACPAQEEACDFAVITSRPDRDYEVIGVIDVEAFSVKAIPNDEEGFHAAVAEAVCAAGGDAVIPGVTGNGRYILATVVKWIEPGQTTPACPEEEEAETEAESEAETGAATGAETGAETGTGTGAETGTGTGTGAEAGTGTEAGIGTGPETEPAPAAPPDAPTEDPAPCEEGSPC